MLTPTHPFVYHITSFLLTQNERITNSELCLTITNNNTDYFNLSFHPFPSAERKSVHDGFLLFIFPIINYAGVGGERRCIFNTHSHLLFFQDYTIELIFAVYSICLGGSAG